MRVGNAGPRPLGKGADARGGHSLKKPHKVANRWRKKHEREEGKGHWTGVKGGVRIEGEIANNRVWEEHRGWVFQRRNEGGHGKTYC